MKIAAIIAECNPFHEGHAYLIREVRRRFGADTVVLLMSGDFVQRGEPAVSERRIRTRMALLGGADLVLSYPVRFSTSSAEDFASCGVSILHSLGCVDLLAFGSEAGELGPLEDAAAFFAEENDEYKEKLRENLRSGLAYPRARAEASRYTDLLRTPNNILAVEYLKALRRLSSRIEPVTVNRISDVQGGEALSGSAVRKMLSDVTSLAEIERCVPESSAGVLKEDLETYGITAFSDLELLLRDRLLSAASAEDLARTAGMSHELAAAMFREGRTFASAEALIDTLHTKNRTRASIRRALLHLVLGLKEERPDPDGFYTQILGFRKSGIPVLSAAGCTSVIPILSKAADAERVLSGKAMQYYKEDRYAASLYEAVRAVKAGRAPVPEEAKEIVRIQV